MKPRYYICIIHTWLRIISTSLVKILCFEIFKRIKAAIIGLYRLHIFIFFANYTPDYISFINLRKKTDFSIPSLRNLASRPILEPLYIHACIFKAACDSAYLGCGTN